MGLFFLWKDIKIDGICLKSYSMIGVGTQNLLNVFNNDKKIY